VPEQILAQIWLEKRNICSYICFDFEGKAVGIGFVANSYTWDRALSMGSLSCQHNGLGNRIQQFKSMMYHEFRK
jgi:hypothetical protein